MATVSEIRQALKATLEAQYEETILVYDGADDITELPAIVLELSPKTTADFNGSFQRGLDTWFFEVCVIIDAAGGMRPARKKLDEYVCGKGENSIRRILYENPDVGLDDGTDVNVEGVASYGGNFAQLINRQIAHVGAIVRLTVRTS